MPRTNGYAAQWVQKDEKVYGRTEVCKGQSRLILRLNADACQPDVVAGHTEMASGQVTATNNAQKAEKGRSCCTRQKGTPSSPFALFVAFDSGMSCRELRILDAVHSRLEMVMRL